MEQYPLLAMRNISKSFPGVKALDNLNFDLRSGEVHGILGENGAGKSTLIKVLGGIYHPEQGEILINGQKVTIQSVMAAKAQGISIIHQELMLVPHMTVAENIYLTREPKTHSGRIDKAKMNADAQSILDGLGTQIRADTLVGRLSIAQQQQVEIAKALSMNAKILVMDEPTSSLTESEVGVLFQIMRRLRQQGVGIIYISHRMAELFEITDRITVIRDGRFIGTRVTSETDADSLIAMMVGAKLESYYTFTKRTFGEVALEVRNIRRQGVLNDVSFSVREGEVLGFGGIVGAGRSELMRSMAASAWKSHHPGRPSAWDWCWCPKTASWKGWCSTIRWSLTPPLLYWMNLYRPKDYPSTNARPLWTIMWMCCPSKRPQTISWSASCPEATSKRWSSPNGWLPNPRC